MAGPTSPELADGPSIEDIWSGPIGDWVRVFSVVCAPRGATRMPWLFVTDANGTFAMTVDIVRHLQLGGYLPDMTIVGLGYRATSLGDTADRRLRDYTPTAPPSRQQESVLGVGGADRFLHVIEHDLLTSLEDRLPNPTRRVLYGHSLGGLFALHASFQRPALFHDFIIASPSTWWDDHFIDRQIDDRITSSTQVPGNFVVLVGKEESTDGRIAAAAQLDPEFRPPLVEPPRDMAADAETLATRLACAVDHDSRVWFHRLQGEHHVSVPPIAVSHGLRILFDAPGSSLLAARIERTGS